MAKTFELVFAGYHRDINRKNVPNKSGIYLVYRCVYNKDVKPEPTVTLKQLLYIGEADEIRDRIGEDHERRKCWEDKIESGEAICFSYVLANQADRERAEAALIYKKKPTCNIQGKDSFNYDSTTVKSSGSCYDIPSSFTVERT